MGSAERAVVTEQLATAGTGHAVIAVVTASTSDRMAAISSARGKMKEFSAGGTDQFLRDKHEDIARGY